MAYVREKKVPGKNGKAWSYYQLVEGKRVDGKVRQRVIAHLGKHSSIEAARAAAEALRHNGSAEDERERAFDEWADRRAREYSEVHGTLFTKEEIKRQQRDWFFGNHPTSGFYLPPPEG